MVNFILGESGPEKSEYIVERIRQVCDGSKKIFVIIPEQFSFEYERKLYNELGSNIFNNVYVLSFTRLARMVFDKFGDRTGEYASESTKTVLMYLAMREIEKNKSLSYFNRQIKNKAFINEALQITADLRRAGVSPDLFSSKLAFTDEKVKDKAMDISVIYSTYDRIMTECGYKDSLSDITEAAAIANMNDFFEGSVFFVDEFESFSPDEFEMLDIAIASSESFNISLCTTGYTGNDFSVFSVPDKTYNRIVSIALKYRLECKDIFINNDGNFKSLPLKHLGRNIFRKPESIIDSEDSVKIVEARDLYSEVDFVCSYIKYLVMEKGMKYSDISISSRQLSDYEFILESAMDRYDIPYFIDTEKSVMHTSVVLLITSLLELCSSNVPDSEAIFRYAKTGLTNINLYEISLLENYCYKWGIKGDMWTQKFITSEGEEDEKTEEIRKRLVVPVLELRDKCRGQNISTVCTYIYEFLETQNIVDSVKCLILTYKESGLVDMSSQLNRLWNSITEAFDVMVQMLGDEKISLSVFKELFVLILKQNKFLSPPQKLDIVSVVSAEKARLNAPKVVIVMGANEGLFPFAVKPTGLLSDRDKEVFSKIGIDISKNTERLLADERFTVYRILSLARSEVLITYPLSDTSGSARFPSYILGSIEKMFGDNIKRYASDFDIIFYSPTPKSAYYNYVQRRSENTEKIASLKSALMEIPEYAEKINFLDSLSLRSDHRINDASLIRKLVSDRLMISATSFQEYNLCHFKFYCHHALKIAVRNKKEINLLEMGNLVHMCLENIFLHCSSKQEFLGLSDADIAGYIKEFSGKYKEENLGGDFGKDARFNIRYEKLAEDTLSLVNHLREELKQSDFIPVRYEFEISEKNGVKPITIRTSEGMEIILKGKIDRVDIFDDGNEKFIRIVDYKTGVQTFNLRNILFGIDMQLLLYLFSVSGKESPFGDTVPAGILYMPSGKISIERDREGSVEKSKYINKFYHMSGVLLKEATVLHAMEENIEGIFIPAKLTSDARKKGTFVLDKTVSSCLTRKQFENLRLHSQRLIKNMAEDFYSGNISASPLNYDKYKDVCSYCEYWEICGNVPRIRERILPDDIEKIKEEVLGPEE
ncbi:MAG: hypothetical protein E7510_08205 [Ruminococcus sp.]|nr:hypothetical protein [Ruminococcus sp.]